MLYINAEVNGYSTRLTLNPFKNIINKIEFRIAILDI